MYPLEYVVAVTLGDCYMELRPCTTREEAEQLGNLLFPGQFEIKSRIKQPNIGALYLVKEDTHYGDESEQQ